MDQFGTVLECIDERPQRKVADCLSTQYGVRHLDTITTAGVVRHLAESTEETPFLLSNLAVSVSEHSSRRITVVAHHDCAGNPVPDKRQKEQLATAVAMLRQQYPGMEVSGLWLDSNWIVERIGSR
ncbi:MAG: carbonic anhydrase [Acidimicrobiia bacterium]